MVRILLFLCTALCIVFCPCPGNVQAGEGAGQTFKIAGKTISFSERSGLLVSGCERDTNCEALAIVAKHSDIQLEKARRGQTYRGSIGSDVCKLIYGAGSVLGIAANRDQRSFCVFRDGSMIENNSLGDYLVARKSVH